MFWATIEQPDAARRRKSSALVLEAHKLRMGICWSNQAVCRATPPHQQVGAGLRQRPHCTCQASASQGRKCTLGHPTCPPQSSSLSCPGSQHSHLHAQVHISILRFYGNPLHTIRARYSPHYCNRIHPTACGNCIINREGSEQACVADLSCTRRRGHPRPPQRRLRQSCAHRSAPQLCRRSRPHPAKTPVISVRHSWTRQKQYQKDRENDVIHRCSIP